MSNQLQDLKERLQDYSHRKEIDGSVMALFAQTLIALIAEREPKTEDKPKKPTVPKWLVDGVEYFIVNDVQGTVSYRIFRDDSIDRSLLALNNVFKTQADAELAIEYRLLQAIGERTRAEEGTWYVDTNKNGPCAEDYSKVDCRAWVPLTKLQFPTEAQCQRFIDLTPKYLGMVRGNWE